MKLKPYLFPFQLQSSNWCKADRVNIYEWIRGSYAQMRPTSHVSPLSSLCGRKDGHSITSSGNKMKVELTTNGIGSEKGFSASFSSIKVKKGKPFCLSI